MDTYADTHEMRIGTKNNNKEPVSNLRKLIIFKGTAIHSTSIGTRDDLV